MAGLRRPIRATSLRHRAGGLCVREVRRIKLLLRWAALLFAVDVRLHTRQHPGLAYRAIRNGRVGPALAAGLALLLVRARMRRQSPLRLAPVVHMDRRLADLSDGQCWQLLRVRKDDFPRVRAALRLPEHFIVTENRSCFAVEESLMIFLRRMSTPCRLSDLKLFFGREETQLSRIINWFYYHISDTFSALVEHGMALWVNDFPRLAQAIRMRCNTPAQHADVVGFVDGTVRACSRPRGQDDIQRELYSGHKRVHALKWQGVILPNGIIGDLHGPEVGRRHDAFLMRQSTLNARLAQAQVGHAVQYKVFGDAAYAIMSHVKRGWTGMLNNQQRLDNMHMAQACIAVEWGFGKVVNDYAFVDHKNLKLFLQPIGRIYFCAVLLTNFHTCLYGSETGKLFQLDSPSLENYVAMMP